MYLIVHSSKDSLQIVERHDDYDKALDRLIELNQRDGHITYRLIKQK